MEDIPFKVHVPDVSAVEQGQEQFIVEYKGERRQFRAHDYDAIYEIPGLYEYLFYNLYRCDSPKVVCSLLKETVEQSPMEVSDLKVLDIGAGNGMVGEQLVQIGADTVMGIDIIEEAADAAERDRPGVYEDYWVEDITQLPEAVEKKIEDVTPNCMTVVAALGFDDMPPRAFADGFNMITTPGWVAFNIKDEFLDDSESAFSRLIRQVTGEGILDLKAKRQYRHRFCQDGTPLQYYAIVGEKRDDIPDNWVRSMS